MLTIFEQIADALDASVDGRGFGAEHEELRRRINALPVLEAAIKAITDLPVCGNSDPDVMDEAITTIHIICGIVNDIATPAHQYPSVAIARIEQAVAEADFGGDEDDEE